MRKQATQQTSIGSEQLQCLFLCAKTNIDWRRAISSFLCFENIIPKKYRNGYMFQKISNSSSFGLLVMDSEVPLEDLFPGGLHLPRACPALFVKTTSDDHIDLPYRLQPGRAPSSLAC